MAIFHLMNSQSFLDFRAFSQKAEDRNENCDLLLLHADVLDFNFLLQEGGKKGLAGNLPVPCDCDGHYQSCQITRGPRLRLLRSVRQGRIASPKNTNEES